jgi:hypothetical protein
MEPRRAHANERFFIEVTFESPLPDGAVPLAEFAGPIGPGGPAMTFWTSTAALPDATDRSCVRLIGKVPTEAPTGLYRVTHLEIRWSAEMPLSWTPVQVPLATLGGDVLIRVEAATGLTQPSIPPLRSAG